MTDEWASGVVLATEGEEPEVGPDEAAVDAAQTAALAAALRAYAARSPLEPLRWDDDRFWPTEEPAETRSQFLAIGNAINFRFWSLENSVVARATGVIDGTQYAGSMFMWRALRRVQASARFPILEADFLSNLTTPLAMEIMSDDQGLCPLPALAERVANLRDLGHVLASSWDGQFLNLVRASSGSLEQFFNLSSTLRAFDDPVRKLATVNAIMHSGSGLVKFDEPVPPAIDYHIVKQLLRIGAVRVSGEVARRISKQRLIEQEAGMAIRSACLHSLLMASRMSGLSGEIIDNVLWTNRSICAESDPACSLCPLETVCEKNIEMGIPLEETRYY